MNKLEEIISHLLLKYKEGQIYFTALDKSIQHKIITDKLLSKIPKNRNIIVSGNFGKFMKKTYPKKSLLLLEGGIRHINKLNLESIYDKIKGKDFAFIDDSYYSGKTRNLFRRHKHMER